MFGRAPLLVLASSVALGMMVAPFPASADPVVDGEFAVTGVSTDNQIAAGPDGNMWVTLSDVAKDVARIGPDGSVTEFELTGVSGPVGLAVSDDTLWVTYTDGVASFSPDDPSTTSKTAIAGLNARGLTLGPDGNLWTGSNDKVIRIPPDDPAGYTVFPATGVVSARGITAGSDGAVWVADFGGQQVVRVTTDGVGTAFATGGGPQQVAGGPAGLVAYGNPGSTPQTVGRLKVGSEPMPTPIANSDPFGVAYAPDQAFWFAQFATDDLGRLTQDGTYSSLSGFSPASGPRQLAAGPGGTLWVTLDTAEKIARVTGVAAPPPTPAVVRPQTKITKAPKHRVITRKARAHVTFRFRANKSDATFVCRVVRRGKTAPTWRTCVAPQKLHRKRGRYVFAVRAYADGARDATPAKYRFRIVKR